MKPLVLATSLFLFSFSFSQISAETLLYKCPESNAEATHYWDYQYDRAPQFDSYDTIYETMAQLTPNGSTAEIRMICTMGQSRMTLVQTISSDFVCQMQETPLTPVLTHCPPGTPPKQCIVTCVRQTPAE